MAQMTSKSPEERLGDLGKLGDSLNGHVIGELSLTL